MPIEIREYECVLCCELYSNAAEAKECFDNCAYGHSKYNTIYSYVCMKCGVEQLSSEHCKNHEKMCAGGKMHGCHSCHHLDLEGRRYEPCPNRTTTKIFKNCIFWEPGK